jgi:hypothetical protein
MTPTQIATIARQYGRFQCVICADAIQLALIQAGVTGRRIELKMPLLGGIGTRGNIYADTGRFAGKAISFNGRHVAVEVSGRIHDNNYPDGVSRDDWLDGLQTQLGSIREAIATGVMTITETVF